MVRPGKPFFCQAASLSTTSSDFILVKHMMNRSWYIPRTLGVSVSARAQALSDSSQRLTRMFPECLSRKPTTPNLDILASRSEHAVAFSGAADSEYSLLAMTTDELGTTGHDGGLLP